MNHLSKSFMCFAIFLLSFSVFLSGCSSSSGKMDTPQVSSQESSDNTAYEFDHKTNTVLNIGDYNFEIPSTWEKDNENVYFRKIDSNQFCLLQFNSATSETPFTAENIEANKDSIVDKIASSLDSNYSLIETKMITINKISVLCSRFSASLSGNSVIVTMLCFANPSDSGMNLILLSNTKDLPEKYNEDNIKILSSLSLNTTVNNSTGDDKKETKQGAAWEDVPARAVTWTDSIGKKWVQVICPIKNTGTKNLYLSSGTMDLEDTDKKLVDSLTLVSAFPDVLQPGETGYYYSETILDDNAPEELSVLPHAKVKEASVNCIRYEVSEVNVADGDYGGIKITGRVENTTNKDGSIVYVVAFLYDSDSNMIGQVFTILTDGVTAGDKVGFSMNSYSMPVNVTADIIDHYEVYAYPQQYQF